MIDSLRCTYLAVKYSSSPALVQELTRVYPPALEMEDVLGNTPLHWIQTESSETPHQITKELIGCRSAPHTARLTNNLNVLPLMEEVVVSLLLAAYSGAVNIGVEMIVVTVGCHSMYLFRSCR